MITNYPLVAGYTLYGINTLMLVLALREGELSMLYPIIALTYVWVTLLSYLVLKEPPNFYKNLGIATIVRGSGSTRTRGQEMIRSMLLVFLASVIGSFGAVFLKLGSAQNQPVPAELSELAADLRGLPVPGLFGLLRLRNSRRAAFGALSRWCPWATSGP